MAIQLMSSELSGWILKGLNIWGVADLGGVNSIFNNGSYEQA
jgi:hypothetical protein